MRIEELECSLLNLAFIELLQVIHHRLVSMY